VLYFIPAIVMLGNALDGRVPARVYSFLRIDPYEAKMDQDGCNPGKWH
jgi:hypothetical protein